MRLFRAREGAGSDRTNLARSRAVPALLLIFFANGPTFGATESTALDAPTRPAWGLTPLARHRGGTAPRPGGVRCQEGHGRDAHRVLGPGDVAQAHTENEWIEREQVRAAVDIYYEVARVLG